MLLAGAFADFLPANLNFGGGVGLASVLAALFPLFQNILLNLFNFDITAYFGRLFNQDSFLGKGFGLVGIGAAVAGLQQIWERGWKLYHDYYSISIEISKNDTSYRDVLDWVKDRQWKDRQHLNMKTKCTLTTSGKWESVPELFPTVPRNSFFFCGKKIHFEEIQKDKADDDGNQQYLRLTTTGTNTEVFSKMADEFKKFKIEKQEEQTRIYFGHQNYWNDSGSRRKRPLDSVILDEGVAEGLIEDIKDFIDSAQWYCEFGVPYRRGYMLYGPPGTGKTSFVAALAGYFDLDVCILNLSDKNLDDERLIQLLSQVPDRSIVLLEDVDAAFPNREETPKEGEIVAGSETCNQLTFSGLLNALDGVASAEGRLMFMTTNHIDKLDPALIRPGRVDYRQQVGYATESQVKRMYRRFHPTVDEEEQAKFAGAVMEAIGEKKELSLARLQGLFLRFKRRPKDICEGIPSLATPGHF